MAQVVIFGSDASVTPPSGLGCKFASISMNITQGIARAAGFGDSWMTKRGTVKEASGTLSGFMTKGTSNDVPGTALMTRTGSSLTNTFYTGCTMAGTAILSGIGLAAEFQGNANSSYAYEIDGSVTETWATT
jgi:hypothetical protein